MKIEYLQISNVLSFKYYPTPETAPKITFEDGLNILIGQNGSGKSTALEVINFIFKRVIFAHFNFNYSQYNQRTRLDVNARKQTLNRVENKSLNNFRLEPNWNSENEPQVIIIKINLDEIDKKNLELLNINKKKLDAVAGIYSHISDLNFSHTANEFVIRVELNRRNNNFSVQGATNDPGFQYLLQYNYYKELVVLHNRENPSDLIAPLYESFTLLGGYRNYNAFSASVSLSSDSETQIQQIKDNDTNKSTNINDQAEPSIFNLVRLRVADIHQKLILTEKSHEQATEAANNEPFLKSINQKLSLIGLEVKVKLEHVPSWAYSFHFYDTKSKKILNDINSLSAGQKSIIHLIFESYGRGEFKGGVVVIDEPEIHLHYQFQFEYLQIIEQLNQEQKSQYILVTHSETLINSSTVNKVKRFALDENKNTVFKSPKIDADEKTLIKILDNTRSTYAFFAKKVILVEGDSDRYFYKAVLQDLYPRLSQEIAILDIGGKGNFSNWKKFFLAFGLDVFIIGDFDNVFTLEIDGNTLVSSEQKSLIEENIKQQKLTNLNMESKSQLQTLHQNLIADTNFLTAPNKNLWIPLLEFFKRNLKIKSSETTAQAKLSNPDIGQKIQVLYTKKIFLLREGNLEIYTGTTKKSLDLLIPFCENINAWLTQNDPKVHEIKNIAAQITRN